MYKSERDLIEETIDKLHDLRNALEEVSAVLNPYGHCVALFLIGALIDILIKERQ